jgi:hypothetical protein
MIRLILAALAIAGHLAFVTAPAGAQGGERDPQLAAPQERAARQLARRLVDGNVSVQVWTAAHTARVCFKSALSRGSGNLASARLSAQEQRYFGECAEASGYRMTGR